MSFRTLALLAALASPAIAQAAERECAQSPGKVIEVCVFTKDGQAFYEVNRGGKPVLAAAPMGLTFKGEQQARFTAITDVKRSASDTTWEQPWGEQRVIRDNHTELSLALTGDTPLNKSVGVTFRLFDDGLGFRYAYTSVPAGQNVAVTDDRTEFKPVGVYDAWWYEGWGQERDEYLYKQTDARRITLAETPLTMREQGGLHLSFHEAALVDFPSMLLAGDGAGTYKARLMPWQDGTLAKKTGPFTTPWRTVLIGDSAGALADSRIELNLNEPSKIADTSWIKPGKFVGVWWEMHLNKSSWSSGATHGATTANTKKHIDFAAKNGFRGVLVEGWNLGWDGNWVGSASAFDYLKSMPDFDLEAVTAYAQAKGVHLVGHHETGGHVARYEAQMEAAYALYAKHGVDVVKSGYVTDAGTAQFANANGSGTHFGFTESQEGVRHYLKAVQQAAKYKIAVDTHEPVKDTGLRRTYPNWVSREGARGQEFNAWGDPINAVDHEVNLVFTRMLSGPMDYTPGIVSLNGAGDRKLNSTQAKQLALYVVLYSPVVMVPDLIEHYERWPAAFQFIRDVPTDWETTRVIHGELGEVATIARKDRRSEDWYVGAITNGNGRRLSLSLDFLDPRRRYRAEIYRDGDNADYRDAQHRFDLVTEQVTVKSTDTLPLRLAPGGGQAIRFVALPR